MVTRSTPGTGRCKQPGCAAQLVVPSSAPMRRADLETVQTRYRDAAVAGRYDKRYRGWEGSLNVRAMFRALRRALAEVPAGGRVLDAPCGTGVFVGFLATAGYRTFASDISLEMMQVALEAKQDAHAAAHFFQADIFQLPFRPKTFEAALCMRFMNLVDRPQRVAAVRELARVADVVIVGYYHKYTFKYLGRWVRSALGLRERPSNRLSRRELLAEIAETGLKLERLISVAPILSEAWIAVLRKN